MKITNKYTVSLGFIFLLILIIFLINVFSYSLDKNVEAKVFSIEKGQTVKQIADNLKQENLIKDTSSFIVYAAISGNYSKIQAGEYLISTQMSTARIVSVFAHGEVNKEKLTIVEGWDLRDVASYFKEKNISTEDELYTITGEPAQKDEPAITGNYSFLSDKPKNLSLEGYLFPDTYYIDKGDDAQSIINKMLSNFDQKLTPELKTEIKNQKKSIFEIITMASMLEKEAKTLNDKKTISGILWKRMDSGMRLQVDATILYAENKVGLKIYTKDTQVDSPYNTYRVDGLPLGPICNPGMDSIIAAIYPTKTAYYYYLSTPEGKMIFSKTLEEHNYNKNKYLK